MHDCVFIYDTTPGFGSLVASHVPEGQSDGTDTFGNPYPAGDWCQDGYELVRQIPVWSGVFLRTIES
jgi:hypothetical protein